MRDTTKMKIVIKGILAQEDAVLAVEDGIDGDHRLEPRRAQRGQRPLDHRRAAGDRRGGEAAACRSWSTSGFRRGSDIVKALCMGATARLRRPALYLGPRRVRSAGRRARAGAAAHRAVRHHAAGRRADDQAPRAGDGAAGLSEATRACARRGPRQRDPSLPQGLRTATGALHTSRPIRSQLNAISFLAGLYHGGGDRSPAYAQPKYRPHQCHADRRHRRPPQTGVTIVMESGRIIDIGPRCERRPAGATVIDLAGKYVVPGIINGHGHVGPAPHDPQVRQYALYGVTTTTSMTGPCDCVEFKARQKRRRHEAARAS